MTRTPVGDELTIKNSDGLSRQSGTYVSTHHNEFGVTL